MNPTRAVRALVGAALDPDGPATVNDLVRTLAQVTDCSGAVLWEATILERNDLERGGQTLPPNATYIGKNSELDVLSRHVRARIRERPIRRDGVRHTV